LNLAWPVHTRRALGDVSVGVFTPLRVLVDAQPTRLATEAEEVATEVAGDEPAHGSDLLAWLVDAGMCLRGKGDCD
jgi:hypothetical protein